MPTKRLPWLKLWVGSTAHGKVRQLDDSTFRTWVELLDAAAQQPHRGQFENINEAVAITRRPIKHLRTLISSGLIDESDDGLRMHDWNDWQRWRQEDANDSGTTPDGPLINTRSTHDQHTNGTIEKEKEKKSTSTPQKPPLGARAKARKGVHVDLTEDDREHLLAKYSTAYGSTESVLDEIAAAMNHTARLRNDSERLYVDGWLRRELARRPTRLMPPGVRNGQLKPAAPREYIDVSGLAPDFLHIKGRGTAS